MSEENQSVVSETVSEQPTQETPTQPTEVGALIAESKSIEKGRRMQKLVLQSLKTNNSSRRK